MQCHVETNAARISVAYSVTSHYLLHCSCRVSGKTSHRQAESSLTTSRRPSHIPSHTSCPRSGPSSSTLLSAFPLVRNGSFWVQSCVDPRPNLRHVSFQAVNVCITHQTIMYNLSLRPSFFFKPTALSGLLILAIDLVTEQGPAISLAYGERPST